MSGPIEMAKHAVRYECFQEGLCVTIDPTTFIYTGGEEAGFVVGLRNYPKFETPRVRLRERAEALAHKLLEATFQHSAMIVDDKITTWITLRDQS